MAGGFSNSGDESDWEKDLDSDSEADENQPQHVPPKKQPTHLPSEQAQAAMREFGSKSPEYTSKELSSRLTNKEMKANDCGQVLCTLKPDAAAKTVQNIIENDILKPDEVGR